MYKTKEGGVAHEHSLDHAVEFFSKAGSIFSGGESFYGSEETALSLFQKVWIVDKEEAFKLLLWLRDCRGGAGNRSGFRECLTWVAKHDPVWVRLNLGWIPEVGRWDDLRSLFGTPVEERASRTWAAAIREKDVLAAKWADRKDKPVKHALGIKKEGEFRRLLASIRTKHIVEHKMSMKNWEAIEYPKVPSVAMSRYTNAFMRNDPERFQDFKASLRRGEVDIKADVLFPHDCVRTLFHGDSEIADAQFEALPNYMEGVDERIIVIADTSGSMDVPVSGSVRAVEISQGLALYCSAKIPAENPFHKKFIGFGSEGRFVNWDGMSFSEAVRDPKVFDRAVAQTRIDRALDLILETAKFFNLSQDQIPTTLLIVSDMQFHRGSVSDEAEVAAALRKWTDSGYRKPKVVYWNTAGYAGQPDTVYGDNIAMVSGFSPAILKSIFSGDDFSPRAVMERALEKYEIFVSE